MRELSALDTRNIEETDILGNLIGESLALETDDIQIPEWADYDIGLQESSITESSMRFESGNPSAELKPFDEVFSSSNEPISSVPISISDKSDDISRHNSTLSLSVSQSTTAKPSMWFYLDPQKHVQGPFHTSDMRNWLEAGYFQVDLPVRLDSWSDFHPLGTIFTTPDIAFLPNLPLEPIKTGISSLLPCDRGHSSNDKSQIDKVTASAGIGKLLPNTVNDLFFVG
jgi:PERQ amino acid-rich with GYF domain-containing protein